jgi:hypothetical protein
VKEAKEGRKEGVRRKEGRKAVEEGRITSSAVQTLPPDRAQSSTAWSYLEGRREGREGREKEIYIYI